MTSYIPPTINTPIFDPTQFIDDNAITISEGDGRYLRFPVSQGSETINGDLTITGEALCTTAPSGNSSLTNKLYVDNLIAGGGFVDLTSTQSISGQKTFTNANTYINGTITVTGGEAICSTIPSGNTSLTNKLYVDGAITSAGGSFVTLAGTESISGQKTFTNANTYINNTLNASIVSASTSVSAPSISASTSMATPTITVTGGEAICATVPSGNTSLTNKLYVDGAITTASSAYAKLGSANAFTSTNTFNTSLPTSTLTPSLGTELTTKTYVDGAITTAGGAFVTLAGTESISGQKTFTNANTIIQNTLTTDTISGSSVASSVSLYNEATRTGRIDIGIGADARDIYIGNNTVIGSSTTRVRGCGVKIEANQEPLQISGNGLLEIISVAPMTIQAGATQNISIGNNMTNTGTFQLGGTAGGSALYKIDKYWDFSTRRNCGWVCFV